MPDLIDMDLPPIKAFLVGKQGSGKTGAKASLVCMGYKLRMLNYDNGADILINLLRNPYYPYKKYMEDHNIPLKGAVSICTITDQMVRKIEKIGNQEYSREVPKDARGFSKTIDMLENWTDGKDKYGPVESWGNDVILDIDTFGTLAELAYNHIQVLNGRLGNRQEGFDYQRDVGGAQGLLRELIKKLFSPYVKCNVLINAHLIYVDEAKGISERPRGYNETVDSISDPTGYPQAIGRALSPIIGKYFNNVLIVEQSGSGLTEKHEILTQSNKNIASKVSLPGLLKSRYPVETGLAEIFATLRGEPKPIELIDACAKMKPKIASIPGKKLDVA